VGERMKRVKKLGSFLISSFLIVLFATSCVRTKPQRLEAKPGIRLGTLPVEDSLPIYVAEQKGLFEKENLNVKIITFNSAHERDAAFQTGKIDGFMGDVLIAASMQNSGLPVSIVSVILGATPREGRFAILASPTSGISSVNQLRGVRIAISRNTIIEYVTDSLLQEAGIKPASVKKIEVKKIPVRLEMLLNNQVEAATLPDPLAALAEFKGAKVILDDTRGLNYSQTVLIFRDSFLKAKRVPVKHLLRALDKAAKLINKEPEKFRGLLVKKGRLPEPIAESYKISRYPEPQLPTRRDVERVLNWLKKRKLIKPDLSYEKIINREVLPD
jgi:NitT/TauT family transport system substrate-binding protein